jgi:membrane protein
MGDVLALVRSVIDRYDEHDTLTFAGAIAYKVLFAIVPLLLFGLGLAGSLGFGEHWSQDWAPKVKDAVSPPLFQVIDDAAQRALRGERGFWITAGLILAVWAISGAARGIMDALDRIYSVRRQRSFRERMAVSLALGLGVTVLLLAAAACVTLAPAPAWVRWPVAALLLVAVDGLLIAFAPADRQPWHWISAGTALSVAAWLGTSVALGFYVTALADYGSVYGALATFVILLTYLYFAAAAFLTGVEVDDLLRDHASAR